ncbi:MAG TPA: monovalent cation/H(+) antiporter subunit G [Segeticoccus sp.]|uniref:monovalent cation/H(+) antiporter subunit G n=1 Tax=Segeticoccus sp. TaxID=2706531 RepID=UPI002D7F707C|nr:monovalent cation/H(+) antiporter subunit G [Segeticoccus sp.]HET8598960.1 monovalent cation/H(+) antiporter subunit G [Segeticoccus sp.]
MSTATGIPHLIALALLAAGLLVALTSSVAAFGLRGTRNRLHVLTPVTSVAGPLIGIALAIENGWTLTTAEILIVVLILAVTGPVMAMATGRADAQREGILRQDSPE